MRPKCTEQEYELNVLILESHFLRVTLFRGRGSILNTIRHQYSLLCDIESDKKMIYK